MSKVTNFLKSNWKDIFKPIIVLTAICIVIPLALALTNFVTVDTIAQLAEQNSVKAMKALVSADEFSSQTFSDASGEDTEYTVALKDGQPTAYIFTVSSKGYGGDISVMTAIDITGTVIGVDILDASNETPGLGQNVTKESFYSQYSQKNGEITVVKNGADSAANEINAVTGASISSKAVTSAVNTAIDYYAQIATTANGGEAG